MYVMDRFLEEKNDELKLLGFICEVRLNIIVGCVAVLKYLVRFFQSGSLKTYNYLNV